MKLFEVAPPKLVLQTILVRGGAFKAKYECFGEGEKIRYFFVANMNPAADDKIILFTATTQAEKRRQHHGARADLVLVTLDPKQYSGVVVTCVLDCESPVKRFRTVFEKAALAREYTPLPALPNDRMVALVAAVRESRTLSPAEKRLIVGEPEG